MDKRDYYEVLEIGKNASSDEIKSQYRKMAMKFHPDRNPDDNDAENKFKEATEAYEVLSDNDKRARYDQYGFAGLRGNDYSQYSNANDIFSHFSDIFSNFGFSGGGGSIFDDFFGGSSSGRRGSRRQQGERGSDIRIKLPLTLEEIAKSVEKTLKIKRLTSCESCHGSGAKSGSDSKTCPTCNGMGEVRQVRSTGFMQISNVTVCPSCSGRGQVIKDKCLSCNGEGRISAEDTVKVNIPAGVEQGNYLPVRTKGNAGRYGGESGDLIVVIEEKEHEYFKREGTTVIYDAVISYPEAALGCELEIPTLFGTDRIRIDAGSQPGSVIRLNGRGIPHLNSGAKGDLLVYLDVYVPTSLNSKEKTLLKELSQSDNIYPKKRHSTKSKDFFDKLKDALF
ncbi:MAG: molecular chaperone DnaJ [Candidatus Kapabacteria bacterium]|nr:molecular chaperone DnaJ [Candidatus Kapabacteria bacterium]